MPTNHRGALAMTAALAILITSASIAEAQPAPDPRVADIVQSGRVRVGLGLGSPVLAMKDLASGEARGPAVELGRALASKIGVELQPIEYPRPGAVLDGLRTGDWDVTFLVLDPIRAAQADFSPPYMTSDFTYLVPAGSAKRSVNDMDQPAIRIAVPRGDASDLLLSRLLARAALVRTETLAAAIDMLRSGQVDAYAAPRPVLLELGKQLPGSRVLDDGFAAISFAAAVPKGKAGHLAYLRDILEEAKAAGLVQQTIDRANLRGVRVAPPRKPE